MNTVPVEVNQPESLLAWMDALADATRLRLLRLLERNELGVLELCDVLQLPQSTVSRHLKVLVDLGWTKSRRRGTNNLYRMVQDELEPAARKLWGVAREQTATWVTASQDALRLRQLLLDKQSDSQTFFATAATRWDKLRDDLYGRGFTAAALYALLPSNWVVADLACGTGQASADIARCVRQVIAVDNSAAMLKAARRRIGDLSNVDLRRGDLETLPIDDAACDAALLLLALAYVPDPSPVLKEMYRILKPGGRAVIVDLLPHDRSAFRIEFGQARNGLAPDELNQMLQSTGFTENAARALSPEAGTKAPALFLATATK